MMSTPFNPNGGQYGQQPQFQTQPPQYGQQPQFQTQPPQFGQQPMAPPPEKKGLAIAALVLGILAIPPSFIPIISLLSWPLAVLALIFGIIALVGASKRGTSKGLPIAGLVLGAVAVLACGLTTFVLASAVNEVDKAVSDLSGENTDKLLEEDVTVEIGAFSAATDEYGLVTSALPVTVTNNSDETATYQINVEALDAAGTRIDDDFAFANDVASGQSVQIELFTLVSSDEVDALTAAEFKVYEVSKF
jgi:hypothetical protein